jgi:phospholipid/cholesterol/gamma-HCH transport system substrate-binding protein
MNMNERLMQFRIGMFVIVAGLVLTMMIVWFGESPSILRDQVYLTVRYAEAPGVLEGVPVRKSGIRIGQVSAITFDERPNQPDGVLVTLALERKYTLHEGTRPRLSRSLIGDVTVDMQPGTGSALLRTSRSPVAAHDHVIDGDVAPDPSKALEAATKAFESAGDTLRAINEAASGLAKIAKSAEKLDDFLGSVADAGKNVSKAAQGIDRVIKANEADVQPAIASLRQVAQKLDDTLDARTRDSLKTGIDRFSSAAARLEAGIAQIDPVLKDLGAPVDKMPVTDLGQAVRRINLVSSDLELLTKKLRDGRGGLNTAGSLQKLITQSELHDNLNAMAVSAAQAIAQLRTVLNALRVFAEKVSNDPSSLARGALRSN